MRAVLSVYDKTGLPILARALSQTGYELISTGGTHRSLVESGIDVIQVSDVTKFPEILEGRVKTLHPQIHGGILARRAETTHISELEAHGIVPVDLVVVNLYPFVETVSDPSVFLEQALENIDIGGPTLIRAAAKNFPDVVVIVDPSDYGWISDKIVSGENISLDERKGLAAKAFQHVALYDTSIAGWLRDQSPLKSEDITMGLVKMNDLRYGENPHQSGAVYSSVLNEGGVAKAEQLHGLPMSYTNYLDADSAWTSVNAFEENACVIVKHTNPCGIAIDDKQHLAFEKAFQGDTVSAYGGIVGFNRNVTLATANAMKGILFDIVVAPGFTTEALVILKKRKRTRLLKIEPQVGNMSKLSVKTISGGALVQTIDEVGKLADTWKVVTNRKPSLSEQANMEFAWKCLPHIKSNTIVLAKGNSMVGMGAGQPNRLVSIHLALRIAGDKSPGSALASDAFMPFSDNIELAVDGGITAIIQPGGSIRDTEVIESADRHGITMLFTGMRHFNH